MSTFLATFTWADWLQLAANLGVLVYVVWGCLRLDAAGDALDVEEELVE